MKLARYKTGSSERSAIVVDEMVLDLDRLLEEKAAVTGDHSDVGLPAGFAAIADLSPDDVSALASTAAQELPADSDWRIGPVDSVQLLAPVPHPTKILCVGLNYQDHIEEVGLQAPKRPHVFAKLPSALIGPTDDIVYPSGIADSLDYEVELAVVIARQARFVSPEDARNHILGYAVANDVSARDWQFDEDDQLTLGKGFDTFFPFGPWIVTPDEIEPVDSLHIRCWVNEELRQETTLGTMTFDVTEIISMLSNVCTLEAGDVIATGTPAGVGLGHSPPAFLKPGDTVVSEVENIGRLENVVSQRENGRESTRKDEQ